MSTTSGKAFDWSIFSRLYGRSTPYRSTFILTFLLVIVLALLGPVRPEQMKHIIDREVPQGNYHGVLMLSLWFVGVLVIESLLQFFQAYLANKVAQSVTLDMRSDLYKHILKFKLSYFDKTPVGQFVTRLISDIDGVAEVFSVGVLDIARDILKLVVIIAFMFGLNWKMTLIVLLPIPLLMWATRVFQMAVKKSFNDVRNEVSRINVFIQEHVTGMSIVQIFNREAQEKRKFDKINQEHRDAHIRGIWAYSIFFPIVELLSAMSVALMLWWGLKQSLSEVMTPGELLEFSMFITMLYRPIRQMADNFNVLQMGVVNAERVFGVFDTQAYSDEIENPKTIAWKGDVELKDVWFAYKEDNYVVKGISLSIKAGERVAIVGETGAGKTSLVHLLNRFYDITSGAILIDGVSVSELALQELRTHIGVVPQDVFLFSDTILNNIRLNNESITEAEVIAAAKEVGVHGFIEQLPGGYHFNVRERGAVLSVGQRQLLSFVRAYVHRPKILILDEATSSIDTESELLIQQATEKLTQGRTSIIIAHRLSTIQHADKIVVMEKGHIIEVGNHNELLQQGGKYKRLYELQWG